MQKELGALGPQRSAQPSKPKRRSSTLRDLHRQLESHSRGMDIGRNNPEVYAYHKAEFSRLRAITLAVYEARKPLAPEVAEARDRRWRHNGTQGSIAMAIANMRAISEMPSATLVARRHAQEIILDLEVLRDMLKVRIDPVKAENVPNVQVGADSRLVQDTTAVQTRQPPDAGPNGEKY